jgi:hypothetical protein
VRRGPHAVWPGSVGIPGAVVGVCAEASMVLTSEGSTIMYLQFEVDSPMVEEAQGSLVSVAGCASAWHSVGDDGTGVGGLIRFSLPCGCGWWCVVPSVFVSVHGFVRVVVCASARYVPMLFLLI